MIFTNTSADHVVTVTTQPSDGDVEQFVCEGKNLHCKFAETLPEVKFVLDHSRETWRQSNDETFQLVQNLFKMPTCTRCTPALAVLTICCFLLELETPESSAEKTDDLSVPFCSTGANVVVLSQPEEIAAMATGLDEEQEIKEEIVYDSALLQVDFDHEEIASNISVSAQELEPTGCADAD